MSPTILAGPVGFNKAYGPKSEDMYEAWLEGFLDYVFVTRSVLEDPIQLQKAFDDQLGRNYPTGPRQTVQCNCDAKA